MIRLNIGISHFPSMATRVLPPLLPPGFHALSSVESPCFFKFQLNPRLFEIFAISFFGLCSMDASVCFYFLVVLSINACYFPFQTNIFATQIFPIRLHFMLLPFFIYSISLVTLLWI